MRSLSPPDLPPPLARYAHGVEIPPGHRIVRSAGQLAIAPDGTIPPGAESQAGLIFSNLKLILAEADMGPAEVFHISAYVTDRAHMPGYMAARDAFLADVPERDLPGSTLLIVSGFTRAEFLVEVELWAAAP